MFLSPQGVRLAELTRTSEQRTLDSHPAWSPSAEVVAFSRASGDSLDSPRLHVIAPHTGREPRPLGPKKGRQRDARWLPDSTSIVYASDALGSFDLYRLPLVAGAGGLPQAGGEPVRLTKSPEQELSPTLSADGKTLVYMEISEDGNVSRLRMLDIASGSDRGLTAGPLDVTPAFNPENPKQIAYATRADNRNDMDLMLLDIETGEATPLPSEPMADLTGPVWSVDSRHLFATAVFRSIASGEAILSSVVVLDRLAAEPKWRALHDPAFTESRVGVALAPRVLLPSSIDSNRPYKEALELSLEQHIIRGESKP